MPLNRVSFMNTYVDNASLTEVINHIENCIKDRTVGHVITLNTDQIVRIESDPYFRTICENCELLLVDGHPLMKIAQKYKRPFKEKICGADLMPILCDVSAKKNYSVFLLGAAPGVAQIAAERLIKRYPNLNVAGTYSPPIGFEKDATEIKKINTILKNSHADLLFVGMGVPKQDIFIYENKDEYQIPLSFSFGAAIDFIAGVQKRAPKLMRKMGLEWLFRFLCNPRKMFKRYFIDDMKIFKLARKYKPNKSGGK